MARPIEEFLMAWRALSGVSVGQGWQSIPVTSAGPCVLMAGRRFPGNEEALLAGFATARLATNDVLPEGRGFEVSRANPCSDGRNWIALTRRESGNLDLFAEMVGDVAGAMDLVASEGEDRILRALLARVRSWQEFMRKGLQALSPEAEIGLVGELSFLRTLLQAGVSPQTSVEAWVGPVEGVQDFELGTGAVEVKASVSPAGFPAKIGSLEQLDDVIRKPLFLAAVRLSQHETGMTLPEFVADVREMLSRDSASSAIFADKLFAGGFFEAHSDRYVRRFYVERTRVLFVGEDFPRLVPGSVPDAIRRANYEIDFDRVSGVDVALVEALNRLGVS